MPDFLERPKPDDPRWIPKTIMSALPKGAVVRDFPKSTGNAIAVLQVGDPIHIIDTQPNAAYLAVKVGYKIGWVSRHALRFKETGRLPQLAPDWQTQPVTTYNVGTQPFAKMPSMIETGEIAMQSLPQVEPAKSSGSLRVELNTIA